MSSVQSFETPSRGFCDLCPEEKQSNETTTIINSIEEAIKLQKERINREEQKLKTDDFLLVLHETNIDTHCDSSCTDVQL